MWPWNILPYVQSRQTLIDSIFSKHQPLQMALFIFITISQWPRVQRPMLHPERQGPREDISLREVVNPWAMPQIPLSQLTFSNTPTLTPQREWFILPKPWLWFRPSSKSFVWVNSFNPHTNPMGQVSEVKEIAGIWTQKSDSQAQALMKTTTYFSTLGLQLVLWWGAFT